MRITKRTNIAVRLLMYCAVNAGRVVTKAEVAQRCNISQNHLAQIVNQLGQRGFVTTRRGRNGGLRLRRAATEITVGEVFRSFEGELPLVECFADADNTCPLVSACRLRHALTRAGEAFYQALDEITLDSLTCGNLELHSLLSPLACPTPDRSALARG